MSSESAQALAMADASQGDVRRSAGAEAVAVEETAGAVPEARQEEPVRHSSICLNALLEGEEALDMAPGSAAAAATAGAAMNASSRRSTHELNDEPKLLLPPVFEPHEVSVMLGVEGPGAGKGAKAGAVGGVKRMGAADGVRASCPAVVTRQPEHVPSYLRPTAAYQARSSKAGPEPAIAEEASKTKKASRRLAGVLARVFAPTAAFLARVTGKSKSKQDVTDDMRKSTVEKILKSPQGQRVTQAAPFALRQTARGKESLPLPTEEAELLEAQRNMFKKHEVPKHVHEHRPIEGFRSVTVPKSPEQIFEPFNLASQERHSAELAKRAAELAAERKAQQEHRVFRAMPFDKTVVEKIDSPRRLEPKLPTVPEAPRLAVDARSKHHELQLTPAKRARMTAAERQKLEEHEAKVRAEEAAAAAEQQRDQEEKRRQAALDKLEVAELRKSMVFKARPMPGFESVFRPDPSKAPKVTQSAEFKFSTDERLGKALGAVDRLDWAAPQIGSPHFAASLRSSTTAVAAGAKALPSPRSRLGLGSSTSPSMGARPAARPGSGVRASHDSAALGDALSSALHSFRRSANAGTPTRNAAAGASHNSPRVRAAA